MVPCQIRDIRDADVCEDRFGALMKARWFRWPEDKAGPLIWILKLGTVDDFLWVTRVSVPAFERKIMFSIASEILSAHLDMFRTNNPGVPLSGLLAMAGQYVAGIDLPLREELCSLAAKRNSINECLPVFDSVCIAGMIALGGTPMEMSEMIRGIARYSQHIGPKIVGKKGIQKPMGILDALEKTTTLMRDALVAEEARQAEIIKRHVQMVEMPKEEKYAVLS